MKTKTTAPDMLSWQYRVILQQLDQVQLHASDSTCPCELHDMGEYCIPKHLNLLASLANETAAMDSQNAELFFAFGEEAAELHLKTKGHVCGKGEDTDIVTWSRNWRKKIEPLYYACPTGKGKLRDFASLFEEPAIRVSGKCEDQTCSFTVTHSEKIAAKAGSIKALPSTIAEVLKALERKEITATDMTFAFGTTGLVRYELRHRIVDGDKLIVSHNAHTFEENPKFPMELQPRDRTRAATQLQVRNIAKNMNPDLLLVDFRSTDKGAPIIYKDLIVESGNGRVMALLLAADEVKDKLNEYRQKLKDIAPAYGLSPLDADKYRVPVLVRERLTPVNNRKSFVDDCNARSTLAMSAIEQARRDAVLITFPMLNSLELLENESIDQALRAPRNNQFVTEFIKALPANERGSCLDPKGLINTEGIRRAILAVFVATFQGEVGIRLAQAAFEELDNDVKTCLNGIAASLGYLAQAEKLTQTGQRQADYTIGEDIAIAIRKFGEIKRITDYTVEKYLAQMQLQTRELTPFQEHILAVLSKHSRSSKRIATILMGYATLVINSPPPQQASFMGGARQTKEQLFALAVKRAEYEAEAERSQRETRREAREKVAVSDLSDYAHLFAPPIPREQIPMELFPEFKPIPEPPDEPVLIRRDIPLPQQGPTVVQGKPVSYHLFPFQQEGVEWLKDRSAALLADEMGLGKTPQAIHWGAMRQPVLIVVPASLSLNWQREIKDMWRPQDSVLWLDGTAELPRDLPNWTILSYGMLNHYLPKLRRAGFRSIIIDEAHLVKNMETQRTENILNLVAPREMWELQSYKESLEKQRFNLSLIKNPETKAAEEYRQKIADTEKSIARLEELVARIKPIPDRLAVTGTPIVNRPIELFPLLVFLGKKTRGEYRNFLERYTEHKYGRHGIIFTGARNLAELYNYLTPFMLRRLKKDVLKQLPPKTNTPMFVPITTADQYRKAEQDFLRWLAEERGRDAALRASRAEIIVQMNALRQIAAMGKVQPVADWLKPCYEGRGKVVVFSSFKEPLERLAKLKNTKAVYTGELSPEERQAYVDKFQQNAEECYFMGTVGAAGVGITLTAAERVAFLDLPWTPGAKIQAEDRAHRIGQNKPVEIVNILAIGTIDERMLRVLAQKEFIIAQTIDGKRIDEAMRTSIANELLEHFIRQPGLSESVCDYEGEMADPDVEQLTEEEVNILQGLREVAELDDITGALAKKLDKCNLTDEELRKALAWKPLRNVIATGVGAGARVELCSIGMVQGVYQVTLDNLSIDAEHGIANIVMKTSLIKRVYSAVPQQRVYEVVLPAEGKPELTWESQEIHTRPMRLEPATQAAMFDYAHLFQNGVVTVTGKCETGIENCIFKVKREGQTASVPSFDALAHAVKEQMQKPAGAKALELGKPLKVVLGDRTFVFAPETYRKMTDYADGTKNTERGFPLCERGGVLYPGGDCKGTMCSIDMQSCSPSEGYDKGFFHTHPVPADVRADTRESMALAHSTGDLLNAGMRAGIHCVSGKETDSINCAALKSGEKPLPPILYRSKTRSWAYFLPTTPKDIQQRVKSARRQIFYPEVGAKFDFTLIPKAEASPLTLGVTKPAWQMTWKEWIDYWESSETGSGNKFSFAERIGTKLGIKTQAGEPLYRGETPDGIRILGESGQDARERWRKAIIRQALSEGKLVPAEVLKDYSDLAKIKPVTPTAPVTPEVTIPSDIQKVINRIKKLDITHRELQTKADQILSTSAFGQAPPVYHSTLDKALKIQKQKAELWNQIRGRIIPGTHRTLWQKAMDERLPTVSFGQEEHLDFFAEDIEKLFAIPEAVTPTAQGKLFDSMRIKGKCEGEAEECDFKVTKQGESATGTGMKGLEKAIKVVSGEPAKIPASLGKCQTVKVHDDGDLTVKCGGKLYVVTKDLKVFEQVKEQPLQDRRAPYSRKPKEIILYPSAGTVEFHYRAKSDFHKDSFRVLKPNAETLLFVACPKSQAWKPPSQCGKQMRHKMVVRLTLANRAKYQEQIQDFRDQGVLVRTGKKGMETVPRLGESEEVELEVRQALGHVVEIEESQHA